MWVARNVLIEHQVRKDWPKVGELKGSSEMGNREWRWLAVVSQTEEQELRLSLIHISEPTRLLRRSRMPSSA